MTHLTSLPGRWRKVLVAVGCVAICVLMVVSVLWSTDKYQSLPQLEIGQPFATCGHFKFGKGDRILEVTKDDSGNIRIAVRTQATVTMLIPYTRIPYLTKRWYSVSHQDVFESEREWFVAVDQYDRVWVYYGPWDQAWGPLRQLPSGGTRPYRPGVSMHGVSFLQNKNSGPIVSGSSVCDCAEKDPEIWSGVPARFLERVRIATRNDPDNRCLLPPEAPTFTSMQDYQITERLKLFH